MSATPPPPPPPLPPGPPHAWVGDGIRFAFALLTVVPVGRPRWDPAAARAGMLCAPLAGLGIGLAAAAVCGLLLALDAGPLVTGVLTVAAFAALSRGLHLDGLADVADGLGSGRRGEQALEIMKRSDIGPFGVAVLVLTLLAQVAAVAELAGGGAARACAAVALAGLVSRTALTWACRAGVPAARPEGLGAAVAGSVPRAGALGVAGAALVGCCAAGALAWDRPGAGAVAGVAAAVLALSAGEALLARCRRRFGGVTGDVLGAVTEVSAAVTLLALTVAAR
ncbi:adenosylcobinamide-GDP ribazoletransferase [Streptomyces sp. PT12]|uniref:adenosylcobinamide-GDP ribazoletransferase n=1 Tax=Streptomyces sp. PT12 TaxID=1510197 RepID=UPI000DE29C7E|nr:adenosylcobinamide-GDP ribazoletransferase [Streptomyces sp. PT12]RBM19835.1 adenosylcobinamide-GDP ribazoletransferase [Streptomyces sp. PT12]